jgi:hypothetical protein
MPVSTSRAGIAEIHASPSGSRNASVRGALKSIATDCSSANASHPLIE